MAKKVVTNDGKKGGWLVGKRHYDKNGKSLGGIKAVVTDAGGKPVELEGGEVIINREASKKYWKELSRINQSAGNGVPIEPPTDAFDEDPSEDYENGGKIEFNANHIPNKWILNYAIKIKEEHPDVWALGGNIFGNQAFINLKRVAERGHWLDSEEWMYKKWRSFVARHKGDFRIQGVIAMLKWVDKVDKGWQYMKNLIEEEIKKRESRKSKKMNDGGNVGNVIKKGYHGTQKKSPLEIKPTSGRYGFGIYLTPDYKTAEYFGKQGFVNGFRQLDVYSDANVYEYDLSNLKIQKLQSSDDIDNLDKSTNYDGIFLEDEGEIIIYNTNKLKNGKLKTKMRNGGNLSKTPAPASERIKGSKTNPKGTAKDAKSGASIKFDENTLASIKTLIDSHNEKYPSKKITLGVAKAVVRRGMGAYSSTHRPTITGGKPNSRTAWGLARLNAFIYKAQNGKSKSGKYYQDDDLLAELGIHVSKYAKGGGIGKEIPVRVDYLEQQLFENNKDIQVPKSVYKEYSKSGKVPKDIVDNLSSEIDEKHWVETTPLSVHLTPLNKMEDGGNVDIFNFTSYEDAQIWMKQKAKDYSNQNQFYASEEYKLAYPIIMQLYEIEKSSYVQKSKVAMKESGVNYGDRVIYDYITPFLNSEKYSGVVVERNGLPYVKLDEGQQTMSGAKSTRWHKGWKKQTSNFEHGGNLDAKDSVTIDIPLMIRLLELSREDIKSDAELHFVVENLLKLKNKPVLTMDDYAFIADVEHNHLKKYDLGGKMPEGERTVDLGFGGLGNGTTVWDRNRIHNNDYKIVAHISNEGKITYYDKKLPEYAINQIESMAENDKKRYEDMNGLSTGYDFNPIQTPLN